MRGEEEQVKSEEQVEVGIEIVVEEELEGEKRGGRITCTWGPRHSSNKGSCMAALQLKLMFQGDDLPTQKRRGEEIHKREGYSRVE